MTHSLSLPFGVCLCLYLSLFKLSFPLSILISNFFSLGVEVEISGGKGDLCGHGFVAKMGF